MKKKIINTAAAISIVAGLALSVTAPWWIVWLVIFPVMYAAVIVLLKVNTKWIEEV